MDYQDKVRSGVMFVSILSRPSFSMLHVKKHIEKLSGKRHGVEVNTCSFQDGWSALYVASANGHTSVVELLIESGAQLDIQTKVLQYQL